MDSMIRRSSYALRMKGLLEEFTETELVLVMLAASLGFFDDSPFHPSSFNLILSSFSTAIFPSIQLNYLVHFFFLTYFVLFDVNSHKGRELLFLILHPVPSMLPGTKKGVIKYL